MWKKRQLQGSFKSLIRSFPFYKFMILDNTNYNQKMYFVSAAPKAPCIQYLTSKQ